MISYDYVIEDCGDGSSCLRVFFNKQAFDLYMEKMEEINQDHYITDSGFLRVEGNIFIGDLYTEKDVEDMF